MKPILVFVTVPNAEKAAELARLLVEKNLAACANIIPGFTSIYRWQGKVEEATEVLLLIKSAQELWDPLQAAIRSVHPYECPEIIAIAPERVEENYAVWWKESLA